MTQELPEVPLPDEFDKSLSQEDAARFWSKVDISDQDGQCWNWRGGLSRGGYGRFWLNGKTRGAHRIAWYLSGGLLPREMFVCHRCDNPQCVRPDHLFVGTNSDNMLDCSKKGRISKAITLHHAVMPGSSNPRAVLTEDAIPRIRAMHVSGESYAAIASKFRVSPTAIAKIVTGKAWKHVK